MEEQARKLAPVAVAHELWAFILRPRQVIADRKTSWKKPTSAWSVLGWCSATIIAVLGVYGLLFGSLVANLSSLGGDAPPVQTVVEHQTAADPIELVAWRLTWRVGASIDLPQALEKALTVPQLACFRFGFTEVELDNVVPAKLGRGSFPFLSQGLYAVLLVLCLFPAARLVGGAGSLADTIRAGTLFLAYTAVTVVVLTISCALLTIHTIELPLWLISVAWLLLVQLPAVVLLVRGYFATFSEHFGFSKKRLLLSSVIAVPISTVVAPLVLIPGIYVIIRFQHVLDVFL